MESCRNVSELFFVQADIDVLALNISVILALDTSGGSIRFEFGCSSVLIKIGATSGISCVE